MRTEPLVFQYRLFSFENFSDMYPVMFYTIRKSMLRTPEHHLESHLLLLLKCKKCVNNDAKALKCHRECSLLLYRAMPEESDT